MLRIKDSSAPSSITCCWSQSVGGAEIDGLSQPSPITQVRVLWMKRAESIASTVAISVIADRLIGTATTEIHFHDQSKQKSLWAALPLPFAECFLFILVWVEWFGGFLVWGCLLFCFILFCLFVCLHFAFLPTNSNAYLKFIWGKRIQLCCKQHPLAAC